MARLHLFAEGTTELVFTREVLIPHLASLGVYLYNPVRVAEAYLFTDLARLSQLFDNSSRGIRELQHDADGAKSPELIDDGQHSAPSKRITAQFPTYERLKTTVGPQMAKLIGLQKIRSACPHFDQWVGRLEQLASTPP